MGAVKMDRDEAMHRLRERLDSMRDQGVTPSATYFDCGELGICYVYFHAGVWWFRWIEPAVAPWLL